MSHTIRRDYLGEIAPESHKRQLKHGQCRGCVYCWRGSYKKLWRDKLRHSARHDIQEGLSS